MSEGEHFMPEDSKQTSKLPYHPPRITRIVLRKDQAILSTCSTTKVGNSDSSGTRCITACGKQNGPAHDDSDQ